MECLTLFRVMCYGAEIKGKMLDFANFFVLLVFFSYSFFSVVKPKCLRCSQAGCVLIRIFIPDTIVVCDMRKLTDT